MCLSKSQGAWSPTSSSMMTSDRRGARGFRGIGVDLDAYCWNRGPAFTYNFVRMLLPVREHEGSLSPLPRITKVSQPCTLGTLEREYAAERRRPTAPARS